MVVGPTQSGKTTGLVVPAMSEWGGPVRLDVGQDPTCSSRPSPPASEARRGSGVRPDAGHELGHAVWSPLSAATSGRAPGGPPHALLGVGEQRRRTPPMTSFWRPAGARYLAAAAVRRHRAADLTMARRPALDRDLGNSTSPRSCSTLPTAAGADPALDAIQSVVGADQRFRLQPAADGRDRAGRLAGAAGRRRDDGRVADQRRAGCSAAQTPSIIDRAGQRPAAPQRTVRCARRRHRRRRLRAQRADRPADRPRAAARARRGCNIAPLPTSTRSPRPAPGRACTCSACCRTSPRPYDRWGRDRAETIIANHRARLFCSGIGDRATLDYLRATLGDEEIARISTQQRGLATPGSKTRSTEHRPLAAPHRVRQADRSAQPARVRAARARMDHPAPRARQHAPGPPGATAGQRAPSRRTAQRPRRREPDREPRP